MAYRNLQASEQRVVDTVITDVLAKGDEHQRVNPYSFNDSEHF